MMACPKILININRPARGWYVIELLKHINAGNYSKATLARTKRPVKPMRSRVNWQSNISAP